jgi:hypothetical protein
VRCTKDRPARCEKHLTFSSRRWRGYPAAPAVPALPADIRRPLPWRAVGQPQDDRFHEGRGGEAAAVYHLPQATAGIDDEYCLYLNVGSAAKSRGDRLADAMNPRRQLSGRLRRVSVLRGRQRGQEGCRVNYRLGSPGFLGLPKLSTEPGGAAPRVTRYMPGSWRSCGCLSPRGQGADDPMVASHRPTIRISRCGLCPATHRPRSHLELPRGEEYGCPVATPSGPANAQAVLRLVRSRPYSRSSHDPDPEILSEIW